MRSRPTRFADVPDSGLDVHSRKVFENSVEELGYKETLVNLPKSQYEINYSDEVYNSGNSKPGYALYGENTRDIKRSSMNCPNRR